MARGQFVPRLLRAPTLINCPWDGVTFTAQSKRNLPHRPVRLCEQQPGAFKVMPRSSTVDGPVPLGTGAGAAVVAAAGATRDGAHSTSTACLCTHPRAFLTASRVTLQMGFGKPLSEALWSRARSAVRVRGAHRLSHELDEGSPDDKAEGSGAAEALSPSYECMVTPRLHG
eukprot:CAMPEP_0115379396 /NCGR_PEP_ID=MMETSP0271-20121206/4510_1 /TAXON_ID=71861 /ORGANISM="Scrippsiella trochoidea, Strain CCMP3099" /LENGTH=170 /DNA_ID=CAMNT_0002802597 /DNA_START=814 /DNA_END=1324 /DNA_ORIENTATION=+